MKAAPGTTESFGRTAENAHLAQGVRDWLEEAYGGTRLGRQELDGVLFEEPAGALFPRALIEACRVAAFAPPLAGPPAVRGDGALSEARRRGGAARRDWRGLAAGGGGCGSTGVGRGGRVRDRGLRAGRGRTALRAGGCERERALARRLGAGGGAGGGGSGADRVVAEKNQWRRHGRERAAGGGGRIAGEAGQREPGQGGPGRAGGGPVRGRAGRASPGIFRNWRTSWRGWYLAAATPSPIAVRARRAGASPIGRCPRLGDDGIAEDDGRAGIRPP